MGKLVSFNPDTFVSAGLADDFDGEITRARYVKWDYNGSRPDNPILAAAITVQPDEESGYDEFTQYYSAGDLQYFVPSDDGDNEEDEGTGIMQVGHRPALNRNSNWAQFMIALGEAGFDGGGAGEDITTLEGMRAHFNRIPQPKRGGVQNTDEEGRVREIMVVTEVLEAPGSKKSKGKGRGSSKSASNGSAELDERLVEVIVGALAEEEELSKSQLPQFVMKAFDGKEKTQAVKRVMDAAFLGAQDAFTFDADEGTLSL